MNNDSVRQTLCEDFLFDKKKSYHTLISSFPFVLFPPNTMTPVCVRGVKSAVIQTQNLHFPVVMRWKMMMWVCFLEGWSWERRGGGHMSELLSHRQSHLRQGQKTKFFAFDFVVLHVSHLIWWCLPWFSGGLYLRRACRSSTFCTWKDTGGASVLKPFLLLWLYGGEFRPPDSEISQV